MIDGWLCCLLQELDTVVKFRRNCARLFLTGVLFSGAASCYGAEPVHFPWGSAQRGSTVATVPSAVHLTLTRPAHKRSGLSEQLTVMEQLPPKPAYAYGWFGSNPSSHWGRHFGSINSYTQWTRR